MNAMLQNATVAQHAIANPVLADVTIDICSHTQIIPLSGKTHTGDELPAPCRCASHAA
jgi:hypothetical protein